MQAAAILDKSSLIFQIYPGSTPAKACTVGVAPHLTRVRIEVGALI